MVNIGESLKEIRESRNLSQLQLAKNTGIKQQNISRWESNQNIPNVLDCIVLANYYNVTLGYLVGIEDENGNKTITNNYGDIYNITNNAPSKTYITKKERKQG